MEHHYADIITQVLSVCDATTNTLLSTLDTLPLQRLSITLRHLFPRPTTCNFSYPLFSRITHLDLFDWADDSWARGCAPGSRRCRTHLSFHDYFAVPDDFVPNSFCMDALAYCESLEVLVIVTRTSSSASPSAPDRAALTAYPLFVMLKVLDYLDAWENRARGGEDYWSVADALVKKRRSAGTKHILYGASSSLFRYSPHFGTVSSRINFFLSD
ncbi:hypothetical protein C8R44DRAFT_870664 [Mycena epipterygia]|nr:hypothetical protein C8R44DRAFT_870664 [Mycena epipterygia]